MFAHKHIVFLGLLAINQVYWINGAPAENADVPHVRSRRQLMDPQIVGGSTVNIEDVPYQASLEKFWMSTCGAVIIGPRWLLTAAHCTFELDFVSKRTTWVRVGSATNIIFNWGGKTHSIEKMISHPENDDSIDYDLALIKLNTPIEISARSKPIPLLAPGQGQGFIDYTKNATVSGWGLTGEDGFFPAFYLRKVDIPLIPFEECVEAYERVDAMESKDLTPRMLCAGGYNKGDSCTGDSGGPLAHKGTLIAIVSWGTGCNRLPGVYANLLNEELRTFVKQNTDI